MDERQALIEKLKSIPWFRELSPGHFERLVKIAHLRQVEAGEVLFREGDEEDYLYVVLEGRVALDIFVPGRGRVRIYTAEPMDVVGWSSVTPVVRQRTATARVILPGTLAVFDAKALRRLCDEDPELGYVVMRRMANVIAGRLMVTRLQLLDMFANPSQEKGHE
jgi:CRP-like cAMP-binding protein